MAPSNRITFSEAAGHVAAIAKIGLDDATNKLLRRALARQELECACEELCSWAGDNLQGRGNSERNAILPPEFFDRAHFGVEGKGGPAERDIATLRNLKLPYSVSGKLDTTRFYCANGLHLCRDAVLDLWPPGKSSDETKPAERAVAGSSQPSHVSPAELHRFLVQIADGNTTKPELERAAKKHFASQILTRERWRAAFRDLPKESVLSRGETKRKRAKARRMDNRSGT